MKSCGIVAEYNPFHNGHAYHVQQAKEKSQADIIVAIMSGNYVQRGELAILDKWTRAREAVLNGVDVVVELPSVFSIQAADYFGLGAMKIATALQLDSLAFGIESGTVEQLEQVANDTLKMPKDYTKTYQQQWAKQHTLLQTPNNQLAITYIRGLKKLQKELTLIPIQRLHTQHASKTLNEQLCFASATAIRQAVLKQQNVSQYVSDNMARSLAKKYGQHDNVMNGFVKQNEQSNNEVNYFSKQGSTAKCLAKQNDPCDNIENTLTKQHNQFEEVTQLLGEQYFWQLLHYTLTISTIEQLQRIYQMSEGIEYVLKKAVVQANSLDTFVSLVCNKRWHKKRVQRLCCYIVLRMSDEWVKQCFKEDVSAIRVLAVSSKGASFLRQQKDVQMVTQFKRPNMAPFEHQIRFDKLYETLTCSGEQNFRRLVVKKL